MAEKPDEDKPNRVPDERLAIPLDPEEALRALLEVKPEPETGSSKTSTETVKEKS